MKKQLLFLIFLTFYYSQGAIAQCTPVSDDCASCVVINDLPAQISLCPGSTATVTPTVLGSGFTIANYYWTPFGPVTSVPLPATPPLALPTTITGPTATTTYTLNVEGRGPNLVCNGDFSSGNTGFTSAYTYLGFISAIGGSVWGGQYGMSTGMITPTILPGDHTTGSGNMLVVDGSFTANTIVWQQTINTVCKNLRYNFSFWYAHLSSTTSLQVEITQGLSTYSSPLFSWSLGSPLDTWLQANVGWLSGSSAPVTITIYERSRSINNNEFALDDISFNRTCFVSASIKVKAIGAITGSGVVCVGQTTSLTGGVGGTWSSSAPGIASVDASGTVTGVAVGTATITYTEGGCSGTHVVNVSAMPTITGPSTVCLGDEITLTGTPALGTWSSSSTFVAVVDADGVVTSGSLSTVTITYTAPSGCQAFHTITVVNCSGGPGLPPDPPGPGMKLCGGHTLHLTLPPTVMAGGTWSSSDPTAATVDMFGNVFGQYAGGSVTITYTDPLGAVITTIIEVKPAPIVCVTFDYATNTFIFAGPPGVTIEYTKYTFTGGYVGWSSAMLPIAPISIFSMTNVGELCITSVYYEGCFFPCLCPNGGCCARANPPKPGTTQPQMTNSGQNISVIPNPNNGTFSIQGFLPYNKEQQEVDIQVMDVVGRTVYHTVTTTDNGSINKEILLPDDTQAGLYLLKVKNGSFSQLIRFIVE